MVRKSLNSFYYHFGILHIAVPKTAFKEIKVVKNKNGDIQHIAINGEMVVEVAEQSASINILEEKETTYPNGDWIEWIVDIRWVIVYGSIFSVSEDTIFAKNGTIEYELIV
jgi:hypothetical protein